MTLIKSSSNNKFKFYKSLLEKKYRDKEKIFLVEGPIVLEEALKIYKPIYMAIEEEKQFENLQKDIEKISHDYYSKSLFSSLSSTVNSQGIIAYFKKFEREFKEKEGKYIYLDGIKDPGNLGGIIRSADAFNLNGVILSKETVDLYNPKTVRSSMASIFRIPIYQDVGGDILYKNRDNFKIVTTSLNNSTSSREYKFEKNTILIIGNEAHGIGEDLMKLSGDNIVIPISRQVDSLNANVAASILMYEMTK